MCWQMWVAFGIFLYVNIPLLPPSSLIVASTKGGVRQPCCMENRTLSVATAIRFCCHTCNPSSSGHLLLSWYVPLSYNLH